MLAFGACEMSQQVQALDTERDNLNSVPTTHMVE